jgi:intein-encoded DNA endonuclease-like protein
MKERKLNKHFVRGIFDAEASVDIKGYVEFKQLAISANILLAKKICELLQNSGIDCIEPKIKNDKINAKNDVYFYVKNLQAFYRKIGFTDSEKLRKLRILIRAKEKARQIDGVSLAKVEGKPLWEIMEILETPYHNIRHHLAARQTR